MTKEFESADLAIAVEHGQQSIDTVVQGDPDTLVEGKTALAEAVVGLLDLAGGGEDPQGPP